MIDAVLFEHILQNLINNALQHTPSNSTISITASHNSTNYEIKISDKGIGFPEDSIKKVFNKFYRVPNTASGGTGLGLSIAMGIAQAQNGALRLGNLESGDALLTLNLPAEMAHPKSFQNE